MNFHFVFYISNKIYQYFKVKENNIDIFHVSIVLIFLFLQFILISHTSTFKYQ